MIIKKNKAIAYVEHNNRAQWTTDKEQNWSYDGQSRAYGSRYSIYNYRVSAIGDVLVKKTWKAGKDLADA